MTAWYLVAAVLLLLANGFFVAAEFALTAARRSQIEQLASEGNKRARVALRSIRELSVMLAGAQLGITMASLLLGFVAEPAVAAVIERALESVIEIPAGLLHTISFVIALSIVVFLHMVVGEMAPKNIAIAQPEKSALWLSGPFRLYVNAFRPFIHGLNLIANAGVRVLGVEPVDEMDAVHTSEDLQAMITESAHKGAMAGFQHRLLTGAIGFSQLDAASVMVPRTEMVTVPITASVEELERAVLTTGHSRFPVYAGDIDHVIGFIHAKDLLKIDESRREDRISRKLMRQMLVVPESRKLHPLLLDMRRQRRHFGLVIDEHGGTSGILTIEDVLEELVGEIQDEYDFAERGIETVGQDRYLIPGTLRIDEAEERLGLRLPDGEYETVAGWLMDVLGRIPKRRDTVDHDGWRLRVRTMQRRRVVQVLVERAQETGPQPPQDTVEEG
ncbi:MAG: hemolysin family protein [Actinomycetota bacterium]|nr:hemolysin family protein [Actinomycetota bacterium]